MIVSRDYSRFENTPRIIKQEKSMHMSIVTMVVGAILAASLGSIGTAGLLQVAGMPNMTGSITLLATGGILGLPWLISGAIGTLYQKRKVQHLQGRYFLADHDKDFIIDKLNHDATDFEKTPDTIAEQKFNECQENWKNNTGCYKIYRRRGQGSYFIVKTHSKEMFFTDILIKDAKDHLKQCLNTLDYKKV